MVPFFCIVWYTVEYVVVSQQKTHVSSSVLSRGVARIFRRVTLCQSEGNHQVVMLISPPAGSCLLKNVFQKGGHRHAPGAEAIRSKAAVTALLLSPNTTTNDLLAYTLYC